MKKTITTVLCATMAVCNTLNAQENMEIKEKMPFAYVDAKTIKSHNDNPFGLVYADAIAENKEGAVNIHPIVYDLNGLRLPPMFILRQDMIRRKLSGSCCRPPKRRGKGAGCRAV